LVPLRKEPRFVAPLGKLQLESFWNRTGSALESESPAPACFLAPATDAAVCKPEKVEVDL
jgi:hypothetical protein